MRKNKISQKVTMLVLLCLTLAVASLARSHDQFVNISGGTKICVTATKTNLAPAESASESFRALFVKYLSGPATEIVLLESMVNVQQIAEAKEKGCSFIFRTTVMQKKKGGGEGLGGFLKSASSASPLLNDIGAGTTAQKISTTATSSAIKISTAGDLALSIKAKDEVSLEYELLKLSDKTIAANGLLKSKAAKDGDDILSPMIEKAVNASLESAL